MNIDDIMKEYILDGYVECLCENIGIDWNSIEKTQRELAQRASGDIEEVFSDVIDTVQIEDAMDTAVDRLKAHIKDLLYEQRGECCDYKDQNEIDETIRQIEERIELINNME